MKFALIQYGIVTELFDDDPKLHPGLHIIPAPGDVAVGWTFDDGVLTEPRQEIGQVKLGQSAVVRAACAAAISGGFLSSALGKPYTYPSTETDQSNLAANVISSIYPNLPEDWTTLHLCCDGAGNWAYLPHTAPQIQQVGSDSKAAIMASLTRNAALQAQIEAATDVASVQRIVW